MRGLSSCQAAMLSMGAAFVLEIGVPAGAECEVALSPGCTAATLDGVTADAAPLGRMAPGRHVVGAGLR